MTLRQLQYLCEIVRQGLHLSQAADALHTSQPGVSKQIQLLEEELGIVIFRRRRNRLLGLTAAGSEIHRYAQQVLLQIENIRGAGREHASEPTGTLTIATTHTQARYVLPTVIGRFVQKFPGVRLEFWQGNRHEVFKRVESGDVDLALGTDCGEKLDNVALLGCGLLRHSVVARPRHPILASPKPSLADIAQYPIISHAFESDGRWKLIGAFEAQGLKANIVFRATDADVCKAYVELGIGIAILASAAFDETRDKYLRAVSVDHIFPPEPLFIGLNQKQFHRRYVFEFISMLAPALTRSVIERALEEGISSAA